MGSIQKLLALMLMSYRGQINKPIVTLPLGKRTFRLRHAGGVVGARRRVSVIWLYKRAIFDRGGRANGNQSRKFA
jgi:hypothetical protein